MRTTERYTAGARAFTFLACRWRNVKKKDTWLTCGIGREEEGGRWARNINTIRLDLWSHTRFAFSCVPTHPKHYTKRGTRCLQLRPPTGCSSHSFLRGHASTLKGNIIRFVKVKLHCMVREARLSLMHDTKKNSTYYKPSRVISELQLLQLLRLERSQ